MIPDMQTTSSTAAAAKGEGHSVLPLPLPPRRPRRRSPSSSGALAMLTLLPVHAPAVPRVHVEPRHPNGTLRVLDRISGERLLVYTPRFTAQFDAGHRAGRWYVRPANHVGIDLRSHSFASSRAAIEAVTAGRWSKGPAVASRTVRLPRHTGAVPDKRPKITLRLRIHTEIPMVDESP
jgi:hypothetical protein